MSVHVGPRPLPEIVLSRDLGRNAVRDAPERGLVKVLHGAFTASVPGADTHEEAEHLARARVRAVSHRLTTDAVLSHESAALVHGLWLLHTPTAVHVIQRHKPRAQTAELRRHTCQLPPEDVVEVHGLRVTSVERTVADLAKSLHPKAALALADSGLRLLVDPRRERPGATAERTDLVRDRVLGKVEEAARHGLRQARAVVAHADPLSESPYESVLRWVALSRGLPRPQLQRRFDVRGHTYYADLCWRFEITVHGAVVRVVLIAEYDGERKYLGGLKAGTSADPDEAARAVLREKQREDDLRSVADTTVQRFDRRDVGDAQAAFRRLCGPLPASYVATLREVPELMGLMRPRRR